MPFVHKNSNNGDLKDSSTDLVFRKGSKSDGGKKLSVIHKLYAPKDKNNLCLNYISKDLN